MASCSGLVGAALAAAIAGGEGSTIKVFAGCAKNAGPVLSCCSTPTCIPSAPACDLLSLASSSLSSTSSESIGFRVLFASAGAWL